MIYEDRIVYILNITSDISPENYPKSIDISAFPYTRTVLRLTVILHYIIVLTTVYRKFLNRGAFYYMYFVTGIFDVYHCLNLVVLYVLMDCVSGPDFVWLFHIITVHDGVLLIFAIVANGLMLVNRFSATFLNYKKYWNPNQVKLYLFICFLISFILLSPAIVWRRTLTIEDGKWKWIVEPTLNTILRWIVTSTLLIYEVTGVTLGVLTVRRLRSMIGTRSEQYETNLFVITLVHLLLSFVIISYQLVLTFRWQGTVPNLIRLMMNNFAMFAFLVSNSITIMVINRKFRICYIRMVCFPTGKVDSPTNTVSIPSSTVNYKLPSFAVK